MAWHFAFVPLPIMAIDIGMALVLLVFVVIPFLLGFVALFTEKYGVAFVCWVVFVVFAGATSKMAEDRSARAEEK